MEVLQRTLRLCLAGAGQSAIAAVLAIVIALVVIVPQPAQAQLGIPAVLAAATAVVSYINNTIRPLLSAATTLIGQINGVTEAFSDLWQNIVYPLHLINQAKAMVMQIIGSYRNVTTPIHNIIVFSATLPKPTSLESLVRNRSVSDFAQLEQAFRLTFQPLPPARNINAGDRQRVDMTDALALDTLKTLKISDQVAEHTLEAARIIEDEAGQTAPGSAAFLTGAGLIAGVENQAAMQRMLAAELRQEAGILAHANAARKRKADITSQFRRDTFSLFR